MTFIPLVQFGPYIFTTSGYAPKRIDGPKRDNYTIEHQVPGREGGVVEYLGSRQPTYRLQGFLVPYTDIFNGPAGAVVSGAATTSVTADGAMSFLMGLRASGAPQPLQIESTFSRYSGFPVMYENDFFWVANMTFAQEAGRGYPYYPYTIDLMRASTHTFGNSSGTNTVIVSTLNFFSGYVYAFTWRSGFYTGRPLAGLGFYAQSAASGSARMAIYNVSGPQGTSKGLVAQTASQTVHSGWNYFPINPVLLTMSSGNFYLIAIQTNVANASGFAPLTFDANLTSGTVSYQSGVAYGAFPDPFLPGTFENVSGVQFNGVMVTA